MDAVGTRVRVETTAADVVAWEQRLHARVLAPLARSGRAYFVWLAALLVVIGWAVFAYGYQVKRGLIVTGLRDRISWGLYIASFVFFVGISYAGTLLSAVLRITKARWQMPITRMAEFITAVALMVAALYPLIDMGRPDRLQNMMLYGRWQSPLMWDMFAITTYLTGSVIYLYLPLIPDFAVCRDRLGSSVRSWKRIFFTAAALGWTGSPAQKHILERAITVMMIGIIPVAVLSHTVVSWIFAVTLREPYNSTLFSVYFVSGAIFSGTAAIILLMAVLRRLLHLEEYITKKHFVQLGYIQAAMAAIMIYLNLSEFVPKGYKMVHGEEFHFEQLMLGEFKWLFWFYIFGGLIVPVVVVLSRRTRTQAVIMAAAALVLIGMWIERHIIVVAGFRVPLMPYEPASYAPTWVEWSLLAGGFALFAFIVSIFVKLFPVISIWEMMEHDAPRPRRIVRVRRRIESDRAAVPAPVGDRNGPAPLGDGHDPVRHTP